LHNKGKQVTLDQTMGMDFELFSGTKHSIGELFPHFQLAVCKRSDAAIAGVPLENCPVRLFWTQVSHCALPDNAVVLHEAVSFLNPWHRMKQSY
jgi:hypothetical protein